MVGRLASCVEEGRARQVGWPDLRKESFVLIWLLKFELIQMILKFKPNLKLLKMGI
jgi:hypothetical protein